MLEYGVDCGLDRGVRWVNAKKTRHNLRRVTSRSSPIVIVSLNDAFAIARPFRDFLDRSIYYYMCGDARFSDSVVNQGDFGFLHELRKSGVATGRVGDGWAKRPLVFHVGR